MKTSSLKNESFNWTCKNTWKRSSKNTLWCLLGCSIGDFDTILFFQVNDYGWSTISIMILAIINGLITSIILETFILLKQMPIINQSTKFIEISIDIMEIKLIPNAVLIALIMGICLRSIKVSKIILVIKPLIIAKIMMEIVDHP